MDKKEKYEFFSNKIYTPIYSKSWWMDAICGKENWDVWVYEQGDNIVAAMPYYIEYRNERKYITKAPLTQNNGILFAYPNDMKFVAKQAFEEKVINAANDFIESLNLDVYEQQYHYSFNNWLPFFWQYYTSIVRYTYVIEDTNNLDAIWKNFSSKQRSIIRKGSKEIRFKRGLDPYIFYREHEKIFLKQGLKCPFSLDLWLRLYNACKDKNAGEIFYAEDAEGNITSLIFLVWDEKSAYHLLAGSIPEYQKLDTYSALTWEAIKYASEKGLMYDFEGSVIKRISKAIREFGATPKPYFRIRKVFNPEIVREEAEGYIKTISSLVK